MISLADIRAARERIRSRIYESPCPRSERLSRRTGCELHLKLENLQMTGSFKERGARNRILQLTAAERAAGVIAASAGNHAQGLAFHAGLEGVKACIVMPTATALIKVTATRGYGAEVVLHGDSYDDAAAEALRLQQARGMTLVHAFDDPAVIAGQGTVGLEILEQVPNVDAVVVPVGGGGLASGIALAIKEQNPRVKVFGVEAALVPSMQRALQAGHPVLIEAHRTIADGIGARRAGQHPFELARRYVDEVVTVDESEIAEAILSLLEDEKTVAEGAGAVSLAALLEERLPVKGQRVVALVSGGNIDVNLLSRIIDRGLVKSGRAMRTRVSIPDLPGTLARLLATVASTGANVMSVHHDRIGARTEVGQIAVELDLETRGFEHIAEIGAALEKAGWHTEP
ncbi:MAG TPA: threonine ammonia-lyase [Polyangiales bacterium]|nr:threonine ammonia-lyase [Polyangiales bacterium]